jgi:hypothetical protein
LGAVDAWVNKKTAVDERFLLFFRNDGWLDFYLFESPYFIQEARRTIDIRFPPAASMAREAKNALEKYCLRHFLIRRTPFAEDDRYLVATPDLIH